MGEERKIKLIWKRKGVFYQKFILKNKVLEDFQRLIDFYSDNVLISMAIIKNTPISSEFFITWDSTQDVQKLFCYIYDKKNIETIDIIYHHKIVLAILNEYCDKGEIVSLDELKNTSMIF